MAARAQKAEQPETSEEQESAKALTITAPLVAASTKSGAVRYLYHGDVVGDDVTKESIDHLKSLGFISDGSEK